MRRMTHGDARLQRFVDNSWWALTMERQGLSLDGYSQLPINSVVCEPAGKHWRRGRVGWVRFDPYRHLVSIPVEWDRLVYDYGPLNLRLCAAK